MKTILEELFNGKIFPDELIVSKNPKYYPLNEEIAGTLEAWKSRLSEDNYQELQRLVDLQIQSDSLHAEASFMYGFKLGAMIMIEVFNGKSELVCQRD